MRFRRIDVLGFSGAALLFVGLVLQFFLFPAAPFVYLVGAVLVAYVQMVSGSGNASFVVRRLRRQQHLGAMLLIVAGVMMLIWHHNEWILCLTVAAFLELYTAFRIPHEEAKDGSAGGKSSR